MTYASDFGFTEDHLKAIVSKAFDLFEADDFDGAATLFEGVLLLDPTDARIHAAHGSALHLQGKVSEALAAYDTALRLQPETPLARVNRGWLRCEAGDLGGLDDLEHAARKPSSIQARATRLLARYRR